MAFFLAEEFKGNGGRPETTRHCSCLSDLFCVLFNIMQKTVFKLTFTISQNAIRNFHPIARLFKTPSLYDQTELRKCLVPLKESRLAGGRTRRFGTVIWRPCFLPRPTFPPSATLTLRVCESRDCVHHPRWLLAYEKTKDGVPPPSSLPRSLYHHPGDCEHERGLCTVPAVTGRHTWCARSCCLKFPWHRGGTKWYHLQTAAT